MPDAVQPVEGRSSPAATDVAAAALACPLAAGVRLQVQRPELVQADDLLRITATPSRLPSASAYRSSTRSFLVS